MKDISIEVFAKNKDNDKQTLLSDTSEYLTNKQMIPNTGDVLTLKGHDGKIIGIEPTSFEHIMTVKRKWFNYHSCDLAVFVEYEVF